MFVVKGWAIDPSTLKPQTQPIPTKRSGAQDESKKSKKRKRGGQQDVKLNSSVHGDDVGRLWERHIEGKKSGPKPRDRKSQWPDQTAEKQRPAGRVVDGSADSKVRRNRSEQHVPAETYLDGKIRGEGSKRQNKSTNPNPVLNDNRVETEDVQASNANSTSRTSTAPKLAKLTPMQSAMRQKLISARFRHLNETLYTAPSPTSHELFSQNPEMFEDYHEGFRQQVMSWPENPVDSFIRAIRSRGKIKAARKSFKDPKHHHNKRSNIDFEGGESTPLPRTHGKCIIADLGCGDARIASTLSPPSSEGSDLNLEIHSFDLHSPLPLVTKADIAALPIHDGSMNIAILCLALMGTNWPKFIEEAYRVLHWKGELWVAEIKSRFGRVGRPTGGTRQPVPHSVGGKRKQAALIKARERKEKETEDVNEHELLVKEVDGGNAESREKLETDLSGFVDVLRRRGFVLRNGDRSIDLGNKMFVRMEFVKAATPTKGKGVPRNGEDGDVDGAKSSAAVRNVAKKPKLKFIPDREEDPATEDEAKSLKPCLYKTR